MLSATWYDWSTTGRWLAAILPTWKCKTPGMGRRYFSAPAINSSAALGLAGSVQKMTTCENMVYLSLFNWGECMGRRNIFKLGEMPALSRFEKRPDCGVLEVCQSMKPVVVLQIETV